MNKKPYKNSSFLQTDYAYRTKQCVKKHSKHKYILWSGLLVFILAYPVSLVFTSFSHPESSAPTDLVGPQPITRAEITPEPQLAQLESSSPPVENNASYDTPEPTPKAITRGHTITIEPGDNLSGLFAEAGLSAKALQNILDNDMAKAELNHIYPGQTLHLVLTENNEIEELIYKINATDTLILSNHNGEYQATYMEEPYDIQVKYASATIDESLYMAAQKVHLDDKVIMELADIFAWDIDFALDIRSNAEFQMLYEDRYIDNRRVGAGNILAVELENNGRYYAAIRYTDAEGNVDYYTPEGNSLRKAFIRTPVNFTRISSRFSLGRNHPILHTIRAHKGVDYAAPTGTPVKATGDGKITSIGKNGGYGNAIVIQHGSRYSTLYAHLNGFAKNLRVGSQVKQGQVIGYVGMTGLATGPHLHYEFIVDGEHKDPLTVALPQSEPIDATEKEPFNLYARNVLRQLKNKGNIELARSTPNDTI